MFGKLKELDDTNEIVPISVHPSNELINVILAITSITTFNIMVPLLLQSTQRCFELEWP